MDRGSIEYELAERIVFLENTLALANERFKSNGELGVLPSIGVSFRDANRHHARVRKILEKFK